MTNQTNKFESLLELLINEENDKAEQLFHEIVVEKSRDIYENLADSESAPADTTSEEVKEEAKEEPKAEPQEATEAEPKQEVQEEPTQEPKSERVEALEKQLEDLKSILADAMKQPEPTEVEVPQEEPKGLTHSPEKEVKKTANGVGKKGTSIQERVFKYINNN